MTISRLLLLSALLPATVARGDGATLSLATADRFIGQTALRVLDARQPLPRLRPGEHHVFRLGADRTLTVRVAQGDVGLLRIDARPDVLAKLYRTEIASYRALLSMMAGVAAPRVGADSKRARELTDAAFELIAQIDRLRLAVDGDLHGAKRASLEVTPTQGSALERFSDALRPNPAGAPVPVADAPLRVAVSLDPDSLPTALAPLLLLGPRLPQGHAAGASRWLPALSGSFTMSGDTRAQRSEMIVGVRDASRLGEVLHSADSLQLAEQLLATHPRVRSSLARDAMRHRGVTLHRHEMTGPDVHVRQHVGLAGGYLVGTLLGDEDDARVLVDRALDGGIRHRSLPGGAVLSVHADIASLAGDRRPAKAPSVVDLTLARGAAGLRMDVELR